MREENYSGLTFFNDELQIEILLYLEWERVVYENNPEYDSQRFLCMCSVNPKMCETLCSRQEKPIRLQYNKYIKRFPRIAAFFITFF